MKICNTCDDSKSLDDFAKKVSSIDGHNGICKVCDRRRSARWRADNPDKAKAGTKRWNEANSDHVKKRQKNYYEANSSAIMAQMKQFLRDNPAKGLFKLAKARAKRDAIPFSITVQDIIVPEFCPILGIKMEFGESQERANSPSLDKVIPELGYIPGNIAVISYRANRIKNDATAEEHRKIANWMESQLSQVLEAA